MSQRPEKLKTFILRLRFVDPFIVFVKVSFKKIYISCQMQLKNHFSVEVKCFEFMDLSI